MENLRNKRLYKITIVVLKVIPMLLSLCFLLGACFGYAGIESDWLSYIGGVSLLPLLFLYLASYAFGFCEYHRVFLHYILVTDVLSLIDEYIGIPISNLGIFSVYMILTVVLLFVATYLYKKECLK